MNIPDKLKNLIEDNIKRHPFIIAIDGPCASGKTTLSRWLCDIYHLNLVHMDDFYLPFDKRTKELSHLPGGHMDYDRIIDDILIPLSSSLTASYKPYDCHNDRYLKPLTIDHTKATIIEGSYSIHPKLRKYYDLKIFIDIEKELQLDRLAARNLTTFDNFKNIWIPKEEYYFDKCNVRNACDFVIVSS